MLDRDWGGSFLGLPNGRARKGRKPLPTARWLEVEGLEGRQLLAASLAAIPNVTVPALIGYQVPLDGSTGGATQQNFTVTSSNPDIKATVAQGSFITVNVSHAASSTAGDNSFTGSFTYQLFQDLTPNTATRIQSFTNGTLANVSGNYDGTQFFRVVKNFSGTGGPLDTVIQGGPQTGAAASGTNPLELSPQLAFTQAGSVAIANAGANTDGQEFFITTGPQSNLNFGYTIYGQVVSGQTVVAEIGNVSTQANSSGENSSPVSPVDITSATVSTTNPNGDLHVDATGAKQGETSTITVTATDPSTNTTATQSFTVTVGAAATIPNTATFAPIASAPSPTTQAIAAGQTATISVPFQANNPSNNPGITTAYALVSAPAHGTVTFNLAKQTATYTPTAGFTGTDSFSYNVTNTNSVSGASPSSASSATESASISVGNAGPVSQTLSLPVTKNTPITITLGVPAASGNVTNSVAIVTQPKHGTLSAINTTTNTVTYTPAANYTGLDGFTYQTTSTDSTTTPATVTAGNIAAVSLGVGTSTGAVRQIGNVLVVTPLPRTDKGTNQISITQTANPADATVGDLQVTVNGVLDSLQPQTIANNASTGISQVIVYGSKSGDNVTIDPSVDKTINVSLDGGHGGKNVLQAGSGPSLLHGWFGQNTLIGGTGTNQLIGATGHVKFKPTTATNEIFAGSPHPGYTNYKSYHGRVYTHIQPPGGTFYKSVNGKAVPIPAPKAQKTITKTSSSKTVTTKKA